MDRVQSTALVTGSCLMRLFQLYMVQIRRAVIAMNAGRIQGALGALAAGYNDSCERFGRVVPCSVCQLD